MKRIGLLLSLPAVFAFPPAVGLPTLFVFNPDTAEWVVVCGAYQSSLLVRLPNTFDFVSDTATEPDQPPDFVLTANGDVIGVGGK